MNCQEAEPFVSVVFDGEVVPADIADHVAGCPTCRERLRAYSEIGVELRLVASRMPHAAPVPAMVPAELGSTDWRRKFSLLTGSLLVPRFAVALVAGALLALSASLVALHAQSQTRPLWFQFELAPPWAGEQAPQTASQFVAQAGYDDQIGLYGTDNQIVGAHIVVLAVRERSVQLAIRARRYSPEDPDQYKIKERLRDLKDHTFTFTPGQALEVPIEGGGTLALRGQVADHQPKIAWGMPIELRADQLVLASPIVISGSSVLADSGGANAIAEGSDGAVRLYARGMGLLTIALRPFAGAVEGQANWGFLGFQVDGRSYKMFSASPITGGDQPHSVWVELDTQYSPTPGGPNAFLGSWRLNQPNP
jgi:hypothetical protein